MCRFEEAVVPARRRLTPLCLAVVALLAGCTETTLRGVGAAAPEPVRLSTAPQAVPLAPPAPAAPAADTVEPVALASDPVPPPPPVAASKAEAIAQMRGKAAATGANKPDIFAPIDAPQDRMDAEDKAAIRAELEAAAARNRSLLATEAAQGRAAETKRLQTRAKSHYEDALKEIEN